MKTLQKFITKAFLVVALVAASGIVYAQVNPVNLVQAQSAGATAIAKKAAQDISAIVKAAGGSAEDIKNSSEAASKEIIAVYKTALAAAKADGKTAAQAEKIAIDAATVTAKTIVDAATTGAGGATKNTVGKYDDTTTTTNGDSGGFVLCGNTADTPCTIGHLFAAFIVIINYLIAMAGFVAVAAIVFAGFTMVYSQGQEQLKVAKGRFAGAIIGLVLIAAAYLLINSLLSGRFSVGVCDDKLILTSPLDYIQNYDKTCK